MKHLIIFLNHSGSRLDHPVYRQFYSEVPRRRRSTLLFLSRSLEERELVHEVADLRKKEKDEMSDVCFHICTRLGRASDGDEVVQTLRLIRRCFQADGIHGYPAYLYIQYPQPEKLSEAQRRIVWDNLASLNNAVSSYTQFLLTDGIFLYQDETEQSLADFMFDMVQNEIRPLRTIPLPGPDTEYPPIFATFNATGVTYPEMEVRDYLHKHMLVNILRRGNAERDLTTVETCNSDALQIIQQIPIQSRRIALQEESFLTIDERDQKWEPVNDYWKRTCEDQATRETLVDIPHEDWLIKIRQRCEVQFQSRFRDIGVAYFYQLQGKKNEIYVTLLQQIIREQLDRLFVSHPYSPETQKTIVRAVVNNLQLRVMELQQLIDQTQSAIQQTEAQIVSIRNRWDGLNFLSRMMGKDTPVLRAYTDALANLFSQKTLVPGCQFAIKLLNELIPGVSALTERIDKNRHLLDQALNSARETARESDPSDLLGRFSKPQVEAACQYLADEQRFVEECYLEVVRLFYDKTPLIDGEDLLTRMRTLFDEKIDLHLTDCMAEGKIAPVLGLPVTHRMEQIYADRGGLQGFINALKEHAQLSLPLKQNNIADQYLLVSQTPTELPDIQPILTDDVSHILLIHLVQGLRLTDLDGFSGQKLIIEQSLF